MRCWRALSSAARACCWCCCLFQDLSWAAGSIRREMRMPSTIFQDGITPAAAPARQPVQTLRLGPLTLASRYFLSPLAGYTNLPFRVAVRELGGLGLATTELVSVRALLLGSSKTNEYIETCPQDT